MEFCNTLFGGLKLCPRCPSFSAQSHNL